MNIIDLQKEVSGLSEDEQDVLAAYLTMLRRSRDPEWEQALASRLGFDQEPRSGVSAQASEG